MPVFSFPTSKFCSAGPRKPFCLLSTNADTNNLPGPCARCLGIAKKRPKDENHQEEKAVRSRSLVQKLWTWGSSLLFPWQMDILPAPHSTTVESARSAGNRRTPQNCILAVGLSRSGVKLIGIVLDTMEFTECLPSVTPTVPLHIPTLQTCIHVVCRNMQCTAFFCSISEQFVRYSMEPSRKKGEKEKEKRDEPAKHRMTVHERHMSNTRQLLIDHSYLPRRSDGWDYISSCRCELETQSGVRKRTLRERKADFDFS